MIPYRLIVIVAASCLAAHAAVAKKAPARKDFAVKAGRIITISGEELRPGVVVVRDGKLAAVGGPDTPIPAGLEVIDASKQVLMPGFVDAHSQRGLDRTYETAANSSFVRVSDALNP